MAILEFTDVVKKFGTQEVIHKTSLDVNDGELMVFVGPSGCGKSTMLRMIAGLEELTAGEIKIGGKPVGHLPPAKRGIAMVFQSYALYPHKDVRGNLAFALKHAGVDKNEIDRRVDAAAEILELTPLMARRPRELSGGQRQRVAIGRAIVREPDVFLFDEPLSNLDAALRVHMRVEVLKLHQRLKNTMIYVTHDQVEAMTLADRIVVFREGNIEQCGTPLELYKTPVNKFVASFIGSPAMNFLDARVADHAVMVGKSEVCKALGDTSKLGEVTLGVRPEDMNLTTEGKLAGTVEVFEHLGAESYVHLSLDDKQMLIVRASGDIELKIGQRVHFNVDTNKVHLFDKSGLRLQADQ